MLLSSLFNKKVKASSILESVIAMTIIATCLSLAIMIYGRVLQMDHNIAFYKAQQKVKELVWQTKKEKSLEDEEFDFTSFKINKKVEELDRGSSYKISFIVITNSAKNTYEYVVTF